MLPEEENGDSPEDGPPEKTSTAIEKTQLLERSKSVVGDGPQKSKKRKLDYSITGDSLEDQSQSVEVELMDEPVTNHALPQFPLPTRPDAPSKTELALQGLDRAQIEAELVDPNSTLPINLDPDGSQSLLDLKTRKRLIDLGINVLFAGTSHPFPSYVLLAAEVEQFRRPLSRFCSGPDTNTLAFTTHIIRRGTFAFRLLLVAGRRSRTFCR